MSHDVELYDVDDTVILIEEHPLGPPNMDVVYTGTIRTVESDHYTVDWRGDVAPIGGDRLDFTVHEEGRLHRSPVRHTQREATETSVRAERVQREMIQTQRNHDAMRAAELERFRREWGLQDDVGHP